MLSMSDFRSILHIDLKSSLIRHIIHRAAHRCKNSSDCRSKLFCWPNPQYWGNMRWWLSGKENEVIMKHHCIIGHDGYARFVWGHHQCLTGWIIMASNVLDFIYNHVNLKSPDCVMGFGRPEIPENRPCVIMSRQHCRGSVFVLFFLMGVTILTRLLLL